MDNIVEGAQLEAFNRGLREAVLPVADLTPEDRLDLTKFYFGDVAAQAREDLWRMRLSGLEGRDPLVATLVVAEWTLKGPAAAAYVGGTANQLQKTLIEQEAAVMSMIDPARPMVPAQVCADILTRFRHWVNAGVLLTALRRASQLKISEAKTEQECAQAFAGMAAIADKVIGLALGGAPVEEIMASLKGG